MRTSVFAGFVLDYGAESQHGNDHDAIDEPAVPVQEPVQEMILRCDLVAAAVHERVPAVSQAFFPERQSEPN
jgi:hypothetical protein